MPFMCLSILFFLVLFFFFYLRLSCTTLIHSISCRNNNVMKFYVTYIYSVWVWCMHTDALVNASIFIVYAWMLSYATISSLLSFPARFYCSCVVRSTSFIKSYFPLLLLLFPFLHQYCCIIVQYLAKDKCFVYTYFCLFIGRYRRLP